jgi:hypothetical protein
MYLGRQLYHLSAEEAKRMYSAIGIAVKKESEDPTILNVSWNQRTKLSTKRRETTQS